jgi:hypothetical protein
MISTEYEVIKAWGKALHVALVAALFGAAAGALLLLWFPARWEVALAILGGSFVCGFYAQYRHRELMRDYYIPA